MQHDKLVGREAGPDDVARLVGLVQLLARHAPLAKIPEPRLGRIAFDAAGVAHAVFRRLLGREVLGRKTEHLRLEPQQDVLGHQHDLPALLMQPLAHAQDAVVLHAVGQAFRQRDVHAVGLDAQRAPAFQRHALQQVAAAAVPLERADGCTGVRAALALGFFQAVQLLEHRERQHEVVILKAVQRIGRLDQHVGIQYIGFPHR